ncbi:CBS domain-containing protein [Nocardioides zeae]|uniref:CBS domain-containing protein n=1 Tax=Nocardioides imazamoxiresistens TaxID=3231893 RepID=A0ABU3PWV5_9ACTN|nr:CBS domain-containing protein [Nocardioides zeae]MDT9593720.1 CBS domain-containing protein [Nocardioides zeae]
MRIQDVMQAGDAVVTLTPDATVGELLALLARHRIGAVVVRTDATPVAGVVSERDVVRRLAETADPAGLLELTVGEVMTTTVQTCSPDDTTADLMGVMTRHRVRHVPVVAGDALAGIVSIGDVVKARIDELAFERDQLDAYVSGG